MPVFYPPRRIPRCDINVIQLFSFSFFDSREAEQARQERLNYSFRTHQYCPAPHSFLIPFHQ